MSEILGTLFKYLLALLAITAVVAILYESLSSNNVSTAAAQITTMQANINQLYAGTSDNLTNLGNSTLIQANEVPRGMPISGSTISNSWGGAVTIQQDGAISGDVDIIYNSIPQEACNKLVLALLPSMTQITIVSTSATTTVQSTTSGAVNAVTKACAANNNITFTFAVS